MPLTIQDLIKAVEKANRSKDLEYINEDGDDLTTTIYYVDADILLDELKKMEEDEFCPACSKEGVIHKNCILR